MLVFGDIDKDKTNMALGLMEHRTSGEDRYGSAVNAKREAGVCRSQGTSFWEGRKTTLRKSYSR